ncbi:MAG: DoxX family protein [Phycisphaerales bacterium]
MSFSTASGTCIIPTLSRLVLCAAFLPAGWGKIMEKTEFSGDAAQRLIELGVIDAPTQANIGLSRFIVAASWQQDAGTADPAPAETQDPQPLAEDDTAAAESPADTAAGTYEARKLHQVTLMLDAKGLPAPNWLALLAALTELVGGGLVFVGLFSRVWGLGLAINMSVAFYVTSLPALLDVGNVFTGLFNLPMDAFTGMFAQLALFVLAFGVFLTGAGPISLDRALFRKTVDEDDDEDEEV